MYTPLPFWTDDLSCTAGDHPLSCSWLVLRNNQVEHPFPRPPQVLLAEESEVNLSPLEQGHPDYLGAVDPEQRRRPYLRPAQLRSHRKKGDCRKPPPVPMAIARAPDEAHVPRLICTVRMAEKVRQTGREEQVMMARQCRGGDRPGRQCRRLSGSGKTHLQVDHARAFAETQALHEIETVCISFRQAQSGGDPTCHIRCVLAFLRRVHGPSRTERESGRGWLLRKGLIAIVLLISTSRSS